MPTLFALAVGSAMAAEWYWFLWQVVPMAASVMQATGGEFSELSEAAVRLVRVIGRYWWITIPTAFAATLWIGLFSRLGRVSGAYVVLAAVVTLQVISSVLFMVVGAQSLAALGGL